MARKDILNKKVLLKLSSLIKFSQNFSAVKMVAIAPHHWFVQPVVASYISFGVGSCFIQQQEQCEKPHQLGKAVSSHTFFFIRYSLGIGQHKLLTMGKVTEGAILAKLIRLIKGQFRELNWQGINLTKVKDVEWVEPTLGNFKYEGCGEYEFSAHIRFLVEDTNDESGKHSEIHEIYPPCKISIEESKQDFDITITSPTIITTRIQ